MSLILVSGIIFCINSKEKYKSQEISRELIAMFVQDDNGEYNANTSKEFPKDGYVLNLEKSSCKTGGILSQDSTTKKISMRASHADQCMLYFDKEMPKITTAEETLELLNIKKNTSNPTSFANPSTTNETANGLFSMQDDYGTSYYYRGTAPNNYIKFGKNASGQDMWWRIIRFNGDGSIRMLYDGTGSEGTNTYTRSFALTSQVWNTSYTDAKYVGWMFGGANGSASTSKEQAQRNETDSSIKTKVDEWYKTNIVDTGYGNYVADNIFCNDRSTPGKSATGWSSDTGLGYGSAITAYGAYVREGFSVSNPQPQLICPQENDKFTVKEESGENGSLTYPVGLITADECVLAGSGRLATKNDNYYLKKTGWYWSFTPYYIDNPFARMFSVNSDGGINYSILTSSGGSVAPVINLKVAYIDKLQGDGTVNNPYHLEN